MSTVAEIEAAIEKLDLKEQVELPKALPRTLKISPDDLAWSKLAESAFEFWDNPTMPSTMTYKRGDVVLVSFPFTDLSG